MSSLLNAARSAADRNRISVSSDRIARRFPDLSGAAEKRAYLSDDAGREGDEIAGRQMVRTAIRIGGDRPQRARRNHVNRRKSGRVFA